MPNLESLDIEDNSIQPRGVREIARGLKSSARLTSLNMNYCDIVDGSDTSGFAELCQVLKKMKKLEALFLSNNEVGDRGAQLLAVMMLSGGLPCLNAMNLESNDITSVGLDALLEGIEGRTNLSISQVKLLEENNLTELEMEGYTKKLTNIASAAPTNGSSQDKTNVVNETVGVDAVPDEGAMHDIDAVLMRSTTAKLSVPRSYIKKGVYRYQTQKGSDDSSFVINVRF